MKTNFPRMLKYMNVSNVSLFTSLLYGLKVSENKTNFYPVSTPSKTGTVILCITGGSCKSDKICPYRLKRPTF